MKRGFFVFEPLIVLVFISMLAIAAFVVLDDTTDAIEAPLGRHAATLAQTRISAENDVFLARELKARYAVQNAVYALASGGGRVGPGKCQFEGMPAPEESPAVASRDVSDWPTNVAQFRQVLAGEMPVPYEFAVDAPLRIKGIPLVPEPVKIANPILPSEAARYVSAPVATNSVYVPRLAFSIEYDYKMKETYDAIREAVDFIDTTSDLGNCRAYPTGEVKTQCVTQKVVELNDKTKGLVRWAVDVKDAASDVYIVTAYHEFRMPLCKNQPVTRIRFHLPTLQ